MFCEFEFQFTPHRVTGNSRLLPEVLSEIKWASELLDNQVFQVPSVS